MFNEVSFLYNPWSIAHLCIWQASWPHQDAESHIWPFLQQTESSLHLASSIALYLWICLVPCILLILFYVTVNNEIQINWKKYPEFHTIDQSQPGKLKFFHWYHSDSSIWCWIHPKRLLMFMRYLSIVLSQDSTFPKQRSETHMIRVL